MPSSNTPEGPPTPIQNVTHLPGAAAALSRTAEQIIHTDRANFLSFAQSVQGYRRSVTAAAAYAFLVPAILVSIAAYFAPYDKFASIELHDTTYQSSTLSINILTTDTDNVRLLTIMNFGDPIDALTITFQFAGTYWTKMPQLHQSSDSFTEMRILSKRTRPQYGPVSDGPRQAAPEPFQSALRFVNIGRNQESVVPLYFDRLPHNFRLTHITGDRVALVSDHVFGRLFVLPNAVYNLLILIGVIGFLVIFYIYHRAGRVAKFLNIHLDALLAKVVDEREEDRWRNVSIDDLYSYFDEISQDRRRAFRVLRRRYHSFGEFLTGNQLYRRSEDPLPGQGGTYLCIAPFNVIGSPTYARYKFRDYHVVVLTLGDEAKITEVRFGRVSDILFQPRH